MNNVYDFTAFSADATIKTSKEYGIFTISNGTHTQYKEKKNNYIDLFSGNTITFTVKNDGAVFMIAYNGNNTSRKVILTSSNNKYTETTKYTTSMKESDGTAKYKFSNQDITLESSVKGWLIFEDLYAGTYTVTFDTDESGKTGVVGNAEQKIERMRVLDSEYNSYIVNSLTADVSSTLSDKLSISNVKLSVANSTNKLDLTSDDYSVYVDDATTQYDNSILSAGTHSVTIKYGEYTVYKTTVTVSGNESDDVVFDLTDANLVSGEVLSYVNGVIGNASGDNLSKQVTGDLVLNVKKGALVYIKGYNNPAYVNYTVTYSDQTSSAQTGNYLLTATDGGIVTITGLSNNYLSSIYVMYPSSSEYTYDIAGETSTNSTTYQNSIAMVDNKFFVDASSGKIGPNNSSWAQFNSGTKLYVCLNPGQSISVKTYNGDATIKYSVNGSAFETAVANAGAQKVTTYYATQRCIVEIAATDNDYISTLAVSNNPIVDSSTIINYVDKGNYTDYTMLTDATVKESKSDTVAFGGSISLLVKAGATIAIDAYGSGYSNYDLSYINSSHEATKTSLTDDTEITVGDDCIVTLTATGNFYLKKITVSY